MHGNLQAPPASATSADGSVAVQKNSDGKSAVDDEGQWFSQAARRLHPTKPGSILHYTTTLGDERLCQRYASGEVRPPAYFLRALLRSEHGWQWLCAIMDGSGAEWWRDLSDERAVGSAALTKIRELRE